MTEIPRTEHRTVVVKLFAGAKQIAGVPELSLELADHATVADLRTALVARCPDLAPLVRRAMVAVNCQFAPDANTIPAAAEVALIPPVSGG